MGVDIDPTAKVADIPAGHRQLTEIVKATSQPCKVLVLDEPTTALSQNEVERLFDYVRQLRGQGVAIVYVSHRMDEIFRIADRATILRDGKHIITAPMSEFTLESMIAHIIGRRSRGFSDVVRETATIGEALLEARGVSGAIKPVDIDLDAAPRRGGRRRRPARQRPLVAGARARRHPADGRGRDPHQGQAGRDRPSRATPSTPASRWCRRIAPARVSSPSIRSRATSTCPISTACRRNGWIDRGKSAALAESSIQRLRIKTDVAQGDQSARCRAATRRRSSSPNGWRPNRTC